MPSYEVVGLEGGLFRDEAAQTRAALATFLTARGVAVWSEDTRARAWALAAEGRNPLTGATCGLPLTESAALRRWAPALGLKGRVHAFASCEDDGGCSLSVVSRDLNGNTVPGSELTGPWSPGPNVGAGFAHALATLSPPDDASGKGGLLGGLGTRGSGVVEIQRDDQLSLRAQEVELVTATAPATPNLAALDQPQTRDCFGPLTSRIEVISAFDDRGALIRCEGAEDLERAAEACLCQRVRDAVPGLQSLAGHRWQVVAGLDRRDVTTTDERFIVSASWDSYLVLDPLRPGERRRRRKENVEDDSLRGWNPGSSRLAAKCFTDPAAAKSVRSRWAVWFDGQGTPTKTAEQKAYAPLSSSAAECVRRVLMTGQAPCPSRANLWAMTDLSIWFSEVGAPLRPVSIGSTRTDAGVP